MSGTDPPNPSNSDSSSDVDPQRLTDMVAEAVSLQASGSTSFVGTVLKHLNETEREVYRQPLLDRLRDIEATPSQDETMLEGRQGEAESIAHATIEQEGGFQAPRAGIELPPSVRHPVDAKDKGKSIPETIGKFQIERELGRGAFGAVYLGYDEELQRKVAVKVSHVLDHQVQERLRVEAAKLAQVESV
jgi:hypothetical protein